MRPILFKVLLILAVLPVPAFAGNDGCRAALNALNRVKERITPGLSAQTELGRERLDQMYSDLETGTYLCKDFPELWYYQMIVAQQLGRQKDFAYAQKQVQKLQYEAQFNPFTRPQAAEPPPLVETTSKIHHKWALVVGINEFSDGRIAPLNFAVKDSSDFVNFLEDPNGGRFQPARIEHLVNERATLSGIREALGRLRVNAQPDDLVVVYLSSHGSPRDSDPNGVSYIITHDTDLNGPDKLYATSLQMIDLVQMLNRDLRARRVVLILDTCFSGDAQSGMGAGSVGSKSIARVWPAAPAADSSSSIAFSEALQNLKVGYGRAVITASRADEHSWESSELHNGYFTYLLLDELRAGHGSESLDQVFHRVSANVSSQVRKERGASQNPSCEFSEHADSIVLGVPEAN